MSLCFLLLLITASALGQDTLRVVISEGCVAPGDSSDQTTGGKELSLSPGAPLVLTHQIRLVPPTPGSGPGSCGCDGLVDLRERVERLEREVSALREKCGDPESPGCCSSRESKGSGCSIAPEPPQCPSDCSDQGRCVDGRCVCFPGFSGADCSESTCPGNCGDRGRCVDGRCECDPGFSGESCTERICPGNCNSRGRCVDGRCECDPGFSGPDCTRPTCPGGCSDRGRCVDGRCVCDPGFAGDSCTEKICPGNCNSRGHCVDGRCICEAGFTGDDCSAKGCPGNCNNRGRCIKGKCVCRRGFSGVDCGRCQDGLTGVNCDTVMSSVDQLQTKDLTQSSVSVVWNQPPVQYESYLLTFTSQKDEAEVQAEVPGSASSFIQTGLAPGQLYTVTVTGRTDEGRGAQATATFTTLPAGPSDLRVVKTSTSSVVVQWEPSPSAIDRYRLTISRGDGAGRGQELTFDPGTSSAHIKKLEAGVRYDITLVAEKGQSQSEPISTQATPGPKNFSVAALTVAPSSRRSDDKLKLPIRNIVQPEGPRKPNVTKVIRRIELKPPQTESDRTPDFGTDFGSKSSAPKEGGTGINLKSPDQKTTCLNRIKVTHGRPGLRDRDSGCRDSGTDDVAESASGGHENKPRQPGADQQNTDMEVVSRDPLQKLLTDTFHNLNITAFGIRLSESEPSSLDADAEIIARRIMQGSNPKSSDTKTIKASEYSDKPQITSLFFTRSQTTMAPLTSTTNMSTVSGSDEDSGIENAKVSSPGEGSVPSYRRSQPNWMLNRRLRPNLRQFWNNTSMDGDSSLPKTNTTEKPPLNDKDAKNVDNDGVSEGDNKDKIQNLKQPVRRPLYNRLEGQNLTNLRPFQNRSHPSHRFFRRPVRIFQNRTETTKLRGEEGAVSPTTAPLRNVEGDITSSRTVFNRSRPVFPRRPHPYMGAFQNRTRFPLRSPHRGPIRRNGTMENIQNGPNAAVRQRTNIGTGPQNGARKENVNIEAVQNGLRDPKLTEGKRSTSSTETPINEEQMVIDSAKEKRITSYTQQIQNEQSQGSTTLSENVQNLPGIIEIDRKIDSSEEDVISDKSDEELNPAHEVQHGFTKQESKNQMLVANIQATKTSEQDSVSRGEDSAVVFRRPFKPWTHPSQTRRRIPPQNPDGDRMRTGLGVSETLDRGLRDESADGTRSILQNDNMSRVTDGSNAAERDYKLNRTSEHGKTETELNGGENTVENKKIALQGDGERGESINWRMQPHRTKLRTNLMQFKNKTGLDSREGPLSTVKAASTDKSSLGSEQVTNLDDRRISEGKGQFGDQALGDLEESLSEEAPGESRRLDQMFPETDYKVTVLGRGSGVLSQLQKLVISTGPEPPSDLVFSHVTEDSVTVSWTRPNSKVSGFKVTYTHSEDGEPVSVSLDQGNSSLGLSHLTPGSVYEVSVLSVLGLDESDPISKTLHTLPDPPTDVRAVNVSDSGALLLWRPALAAVEKYTIVYGAGTGSEVRVTVSGNTVEKQLNDLEPSTTYSVTISSQLDTRLSRDATTSFTTTGSAGPGDLRATNVMPRSATLSWRPPSRPVIGYRLTYWTEGQRKEVSVGATLTQLNLTRLFPGSEYSVKLQTEGGDEVLTTTFTTGSLQFPFPSDCSQEQLNGLMESGLVDIFPLGQQGAALSVWCDMDTDGGGWTVFQRRKDGSVDFFKTWKEYVQGFGEPSGEFWLGLDALHTLTSRNRMTLRVDLTDGQDSAFAQYSTFEVAKRNYRLTVGGYSGTAGDSMTYHNNRIFSTKDRDPASFVTRCAMSYRGGWWYKNCHEANLNGLYGISSKHQGIVWTSWKGKEASIPFTEMKMRPTDFLPNKNNYRA